jgi:hypothetical protein
MPIDRRFPSSTIPSIISILMLLAGVPKFFPYGYYTLLRLVVCGTGTYISYISFKNEKQIIGFLAILVALLFNPIIPIYLDKEIWVIIDLFVAIFFGVSIFMLKNRD